MSAAERSPAVSILLPVFNGAADLESAVRRLVAQRDVDAEIVVVDDGSTDSTAEIGERLAAELPTVRFVRQGENLGVAAARERAVRESAGEYLWFVDADDEWTEDAASTLLETARRAAADVVVAGARYVFPDGDRTKPVGSRTLAGEHGADAAFRLLLRGEITGHLWNKLFHRRLAEGREFVRARVHSDQAMVAEMIARAERVAVTGEVVYWYLLQEGSIIRSGRRRAESLLLVGDAVARAAAGLDPAILSSADYEYYVQRFIVLSALKDATSAAYPPAESRELVARARGRISARGLVAVAARRDLTRLALLSLAAVAPPLYRRAMTLRRARA